MNKCPEGMDYGQWLREKNIVIGKTKELVHKDTNIPLSTHNKLKDKNRDKYEALLRKQGEPILPEDM